jgi:hypothetical protein
VSLGRAPGGVARWEHSAVKKGGGGSLLPVCRIYLDCEGSLFSAAALAILLFSVSQATHRSTIPGGGLTLPVSTTPQLEHVIR